MRFPSPTASSTSVKVPDAWKHRDGPKRVLLEGKSHSRTRPQPSLSSSAGSHISRMAARDTTADPLSRDWAKRDFAVTSAPRGQRAKPGKALSFVIQKHDASRLHYDFRLELHGVLVSWAVPKGPSYDPADKRMAIHVEDHPLSYGSFEGTIPPKQYGAGTVIVWDNGTWEPVGDPHEGLAKGKLVFRMHGQKMQGLWELVKIAKGGEKQEPWLLFKKRDEFARSKADYDVVSALPDIIKKQMHEDKGNRKEREKNIPFHRIGTPEEIAKLLYS